MEQKQRPSLGIKDIFSKRLEDASIGTKTRVVVNTGTKIFSVHDIAKTVNPIARLIRTIFVDKKITKEEFAEQHHRFLAMEGKFSRDRNTDRNNLYKALDKPCMTVKIFERILTFLGFRIIDISYTILDTKTGEVKEYRTSEIPDFIMKESLKFPTKE